MASEDNDASVIVRSRLALSQGHSYGPYRGRVKPLPDHGELAFGAWMIHNEPDEPILTFESNDASLPNWLRFIKSTKDAALQNITLVQRGKKYFFEVTRDMPKGEEYFLMGRHIEAPPPPAPSPPADSETGAPQEPKKKRPPGRPPKKPLTPEEQQAKQALKDAFNMILPDSRTGRSRKCAICGKAFTSSVLFMQHRQECAVIMEMEEEEEEEESEDEEEEEEDEMEMEEELQLQVGDEEPGPSEETAEQQGESGAQDAQSTSQAVPAKPPVKKTWPTGVKRPVGRPRKDGRPPIPRKKRRGRRKRKRVDDDEDFQGRNIKIQKDECIPSVEDPEKFPYKCDVCDKIFPSQTWHDFHREHHDEPLLTYLVCALCDQAFRFLTEYNAHLEDIHPDLDKRERVLSNKFRCDLCKKAFRSPIHLERHRRRAAAEEPLPKGPVQVKCKYCEKSFSMEQGLMNHTLRYHPEHRRFQCTANDCLESFDEKDERSVHLEEVHKLDPRQIYKCPVDLCDKAYTTMTALNYHYELQHTTTSRPFTCEICGKSWVKIGKLREHLKTHSTEKNELCDECGRAFKSRPELKDHKMEMHTDAGREKLNCRYCPATFSRRSSRSYHERKHRNDAPYICPKPGCSKRFIAVIDYKRHLIFHTGAKLYRCRYCSNCFTRSDYLKGHEKKHHAKGEMTDVGPPIEETVTIKVPWPMEKAVKIQGQNVVVIIEPDPSLADASIAADAIAALDSIHQTDHIQIPLQMAGDKVGEHIVTAVMSSDGDIVQQAAQQAIQQSSGQTSQLIQIPTNAEQQAITCMDTSASAAMQQAVAQAAMAAAQAAAAHSSTAIISTQSVQDSTQQIFLQTTAPTDGTETTLQIHQAEEMISLEGATSEQAAIKMAIQQLATDGTHVVLQPATAQHNEMGTTMQATLQGEDGQTQIVMVNLAPGTVLTDEDGNVSVTSGVTTDGVITMTSAGNAHEVITESSDTITVSAADGTIPLAIHSAGDNVTYVTEATDSQEVAMATAHMQAAADNVTYHVTEATDSQEVAMATAHMQAAADNVTYHVTEATDSQEVAMATAQMQAATDNVTYHVTEATDSQEVAMTTAHMQAAADNVTYQVTEATDSHHEVAMATAQMQAVADNVTYQVTEETESQEIAMATAQMQAVTEQMDAETEGEISQQVVTTVAEPGEGTVTTIAYSDISHTLTTVSHSQAQCKTIEPNNIFI